MSFEDTKNKLLSIFAENRFTENYRMGNNHACNVPLYICKNGSVISISFPGYKSVVSEDKTLYDYRVDITKNGKTYSLSHSNIIVDIYNKILYCGMSIPDLKDILVEFAKTGEIDLHDIEKRLKYTTKTPTQAIRDKVLTEHHTKYYCAEANEYDWNLEELFYSIKYIVIQEDINYPIADGYEGRKLSFARYMEIIDVVENENHRLVGVINRALSHSRPMKWPEMDYTFLDAVV